MKAVVYGAAVLIIIAIFFYVISHAWYLVISPMELMDVKAIEANGRRVEKLCRVMRVGGEYLIPVLAAAELFGLKVKSDLREGTILMRGNSFRIKMKLFDTRAVVNGSEVMLRTPPMLVEMPMVPVGFFEKLFRCKVRLSPVSHREERAKGIRRYLSVILTSPLSLLNIATGVVYTVLWISLRHLSQYNGGGKWKLISRLTTLLTILLYISYVITSRMESRLFY